MPYTFSLVLCKDHSELTLLRDGFKQVSKTWPEVRDMGQRLFEALADILKEQGLKPEAIERFEIESAVPETYTSARIAETVAKVYTFGVVKKDKK